MEVANCQAQHEVLVKFIRYTLRFWGPWDQPPLSYWSDHTTNRGNRRPQIQATSALKVVLARARVLSEECCRPSPPLKAALLHAKWSQEFTDILKEIQWCVSVESHRRICEEVENISAPELKEFPWDAKIGQQEQVWLKDAEQQDWQDQMGQLQHWARWVHVCSAEQCGNMSGRKDPRFCLATQMIKEWSGQDSSCITSDHMSMVWTFDEEVVNRGRLLGSGSFAAVTESTWLGIEFAQKIFSSGGLTSLRAEVEALSKLNHPHIVKVFACSENSVLLDLMSSDLDKFIKAQMRGGVRRQPFSLPAAMHLMLQIADAVSYLHSQGLAHRDLKSCNILVDAVEMSGVDLEDGYVFAKVTDFGLAKVKHEITSYSHLTHNVGTRRWMAPEIFGANKGDEHLEHAYPMKADVYSFGVICFEILTGEEPYADVPLSSLYSKLTGPFPLRPRLPSSCPLALVSLICSCWDLDPRERPTFADVCRVLRYLLSTIFICGETDAFNVFRPSDTLNWNPIDATLPFGRLSALVKLESSGVQAGFGGGQGCCGPLVNIIGVKFQFTDSSMEQLLGFTVVCDEGRRRVIKVAGCYGVETDWIMFDSPNEYLAQVEGSFSTVEGLFFGKHMTSIFITNKQKHGPYFGKHMTSINFITNKQKYGPYGKAGREDEQFTTPSGRVVGLTWDSYGLSPEVFQVHILPGIARCIQNIL